MPASAAQIKANQANAARSSGPKTEEGKARSRLNATKHGLAGESAAAEAATSPEFEDRRAKWAAEQNPVGEAGNWALDRVVAATFRIERCEQTIDQITTDVQNRAALAWEQDQAVEAARIAGRLARDPVLASRLLQTTLAGVGLLIEAWLGLATAFQTAGNWSDSECSIALDLLGASPDLRSGRTLIDPPEGTDTVGYRRQLIYEQLERLQQLRDESLAPLDLMERRRAMAGHSALLSKEARLTLRYEREAWKRYWDAMKDVKASAAQPSIPAPTKNPAPAPVEAPSARERSVSPPPRPVVAAPVGSEVSDRPCVTGRENDPAWLDELDRRIDRSSQLPGSFVPIAVGSRTSGG